MSIPSQGSQVSNPGSSYMVFYWNPYMSGNIYNPYFTNNVSLGLVQTEKYLPYKDLTTPKFNSFDQINL